MNQSDKLETSRACDDLLAQVSVQKQPIGLSQRFSWWRDEQVARKALVLAGQPGLVLDVPCGVGRFWPLLAEKTNRVIIAADSSAEQIQAACRLQPVNVVKRVRPIVTSAFDIDLPENAVDSIFCMLLMHHVGDETHRLALLREFQRVTRDTLVISVWVDGYFKGVIEAEFAHAGFHILHHIDVIPFYAMWRVYVLRKV
ncbi:MAG: methyltransferase domain protein [Pseudomonas sp.]|nr:methyltransferase domain protein [Pseudomonas sp.]